MSWPNNITSSTPPPYKFELRSDTETIICNPEPLEWSSGSLEINRDLELGGVFTKYQSESLTFTGNGAAFLMKLYLISELNAKCTLYIHYWKASTRAYVEFPSRFDINFNAYEVVKIGTLNYGIKVKAINNTIQTKLDSRQDINVDITKLVTIGGTTITEVAGAIKKKIYYEAVNKYYFAHLFKALDVWQFQHTPDVITYSSLPFDIYSNEFDAQILQVAYTTKQTLADVPAFFGPALYDYLFDITYSVSVTVDDRWGGSNPFTLQIIEVNPAGDIVGIPYELAKFGNSEGSDVYSGTEPVSVDTGNYLKFVVRCEGIDAQYHAHSTNQTLFIYQKVIVSPATLTEGFPLYDAMTRILQHILDIQSPLISTFFNSANQLRYAHIQSGMNQRGLKLYNPAIPDLEAGGLTVTFKDLFKTIQTIWNVGYSISAAGVTIEEYAHFFQDVEILDLSDRINKYDIQSQVMPELVPNSLKSGFSSFEYLSANGRAEPNTTNERTTELNTASKYDNVSPYRGDTKGILDNLSNPIGENESKDTKGDSDIFIIKSQVDPSDPDQWIPETGENISVDGGTSLFGDSLLNRYFTPSRMLIRHGNRIKSGMTKLIAGSVLRFQKTDKDSSLQTSGDGVTALKENADILVSDLADPIYKPMKHTTEVLFTLSDMEKININPLGYITFGMSINNNIISGYLLSLKKKNNEDKAVISIIERAVVYVKPVPIKHTPVKPVILAASDITTNSFTARWLASNEATSYQIDVSLNNSFTAIIDGYNSKNVGDVLESEITGINPGLQYYSRVRAFNEVGVSESSDIINITTEGVPDTDLKDADGNIYTTVDIGNLRVTVENLRVEKYADGTPIAFLPTYTPWVADRDGAFCHPADMENIKDIYGHLYNKYALTNTHNLVYFTKGGIQEIGWRVPSKTDWESIIASLGGGAVAGGKMKEPGDTHWIWGEVNLNATNESGFTARGAGYRRYSLDYINFGLYASFWSTTEYITNKSYIASIIKSDDECAILNDDDVSGYSIRCVKDIIVPYTDVSSGSIVYRKGIRTTTGMYYIDYSSDNGATWVIDAAILEASEDNIIIQIDGGVDGYRHLIRGGAYVIDVELTPTGFAGIENTDWENYYTLNPNS